MILANVPAGDLNVAKRDGLKTHNAYRAKHSAQALKINQDINDFAQKYAEYLATYNKFEHNANKTYGENLYTSCFYLNTPDVKSTTKHEKYK